MMDIEESKPRKTCCILCGGSLVTVKQIEFGLCADCIDLDMYLNLPDDFNPHDDEDE